MWCSNHLVVENHTCSLSFTSILPMVWWNIAGKSVWDNDLTIISLWISLYREKNTHAHNMLLFRIRHCTKRTWSLNYSNWINFVTNAKIGYAFVTLTEVISCAFHSLHESDEKSKCYFGNGFLHWRYNTPTFILLRVLFLYGRPVGAIHWSSLLLTHWSLGEFNLILDN